MLTVRQLSSQSSCRDAWIEIDLGKLETNIQIIKGWLADGVSARGQSETGRAKDASNQVTPLLMGCVKADGYGHGAVLVSEILQRCGASWLGVATVDEGVELRDNGIGLPILIMSPTPISAFRGALENSLDITISAKSQLQDLLAEVNRSGREAHIHLKVDTGMHRLGMSLSEVDTTLDLIKGNPKLQLIGVFSHLWEPEEVEPCRRQNEEFLKAIRQVKAKHNGSLFFHLASSAATRFCPFTHHDLVRAGLYLYGLEATRDSDVLLPILSLRGRINQLLEIGPSEGVGYSHTWHSGRPSTVAVVPIGYADGVDRGLSNRLEALLHGKRVKQVGNISMDQMSFDVTDVPQAKVGDVLTLIGTEDGHERKGEPPLSLAQWAKELKTITYEMAVRFKLRLPRKFVQNTSTTSQAGRGE
jgi:alanine racemase